MFQRHWVAGFLAVALAGCGPSLYPVRGKVVWENGAEAKELAGGLVTFESEERKVGARGDIEKDGSFQMTTHEQGDGVLPGKHRVAVSEFSTREPQPPPTMNRKFSNLDTSGLWVTVEPKTNEVVLKVKRVR